MGNLAQIEGSQASLLTLGIIGAIWSSSAAMVAIIDALNRAYDVTEWRPWWRRRPLAMLLIVALALFIIIAPALVLVGPTMALRLANGLGLGFAVTLLWTLIRWPVILFCVVFSVDLVCHFAPHRRRRWVWITLGSVLATALSIVSSFAFRVYVTNFGDYTVT